MLSFVATVFLPTQCSSYVLNTDVTRLASYGVVITGGCDVTLFTNATWMRFSAGGATRLASTPPQTYRCATSSTGWYTGTHPSTVGSTTTGIVCFVWSNNICNWNSVISITNCNGFYVYLLVAPSQCALRYCIE